MIRDWTTPQNDRLWQDGIKTLFDPCPAGWRVPRGGAKESNANIWNAFTSDNTTWTGTDAGSGRYFDGAEVHGGQAWYAAGGYRRYGSQGLMAYVQTQCYLCSTSPSGPYSYYMNFGQGSVLPFGSDHYRTSALSVRCIRE